MYFQISLFSQVEFLGNPTKLVNSLTPTPLQNCYINQTAYFVTAGNQFPYLHPATGNSIWKLAGIIYVMIAEHDYVDCEEAELSIYLKEFTFHSVGFT